MIQVTPVPSTLCAFRSSVEDSAANDRLSCGPLDQYDLVDIYSITLHIDDHIRQNPERCVALGYTQEQHACLLKSSRAFLYGFDEPTPPDYQELARGLTAARGYFHREYKKYSNEDCTHDIAPSQSPTEQCASIFTAFPEDEKRKLRAHYGDLTNLIHRIEIKLGNSAKPNLHLLNPERL